MEKMCTLQGFTNRGYKPLAKRWCNLCRKDRWYRWKLRPSRLNTVANEDCLSHFLDFLRALPLKMGYTPKKLEVLSPSFRLNNVVWFWHRPLLSRAITPGVMNVEWDVFCWNVVGIWWWFQGICMWFWRWWWWFNVASMGLHWDVME